MAHCDLPIQNQQQQPSTMKSLVRRHNTDQIRCQIFRNTFINIPQSKGRKQHSESEKIFHCFSLPKRNLRKTNERTPNKFWGTKLKYRRDYLKPLWQTTILRPIKTQKNVRELEYTKNKVQYSTGECRLIFSAPSVTPAGQSYQWCAIWKLEDTRYLEK